MTCYTFINYHFAFVSFVEFTDPLITSQAFLFFAAGFETSSTALSFCLLELAINPEIQQHLSTEISMTLEKCKGLITYDAIQNMSYLDKVVNGESLMFYSLVHWKEIGSYSPVHII
jgi:cytochrome P450 family 6